jgi:omega-6 fatty acid desaturase (delta-12 desaturase)
VRSTKEIFVASKAFAKESRLLSWWHLFFALTLFAGTIAIGCSSLPWFIKLASSVFSGLLIVRLFIMYHDFHHGAILKNSLFARMVFSVYGWLSLSPSSVWRGSHEHHHRHNSKGTGLNPGSFPLMTTQEYRTATWTKRIAYVVSRHWLTMLLGYLTVFFYGMCMRPFLMSPKRHWDAGLACLLHVGLVAVCAWFGWEYAIFLMVIPLAVACGTGSYLFYAQHNFPDCRLYHREEWSHARAAMSSSSFIKMNGLMHWFTGNVGFHHIHHLNAKIPFYRLPEAMANMPELRSPGTTSLHPTDVWSCLRLNLWDPTKQRLVTFREAGI